MLYVVVALTSVLAYDILYAIGFEYDVVCVVGCVEYGYGTVCSGCFFQLFVCVANEKFFAYNLCVFALGYEACE